MEKNFNVVPATEDDAKAIWKIRYHPSVNQTALNQAPVDFSTHAAWFKKQYAVGSDNKCFVLRARVEGQTVGYCRFDLDHEGNFLVSIALHPDYHGQGAGSSLLHSSIAMLAAKQPLIAIIKKDNAASKALFERQGFVMTGEDQENYRLSKLSAR